MISITPKEQFCRILRERSREHESSIKLLLPNGLYGQAIAILRQELDSLVRVLFLLNQSDLTVRNHYITQTLSDTKWTLPNSSSKITDRQMVDLANTMHGWSKSVYKLGCAFVHLSIMSDYRNTNAFSQLSPSEISDIKMHLHDYHSFPLDSELSIDTLSPYLERVFTKVSSNLESYIDGLEDDKIDFY